MDRTAIIYAPGKDDLLERRYSHLCHIRIASNTWLLIASLCFLTVYTTMIMVNVSRCFVWISVAEISKDHRAVCAVLFWLFWPRNAGDSCRNLTQSTPKYKIQCLSRVRSSASDRRAPLAPRQHSTPPTTMIAASASSSSSHTILSWQSTSLPPWRLPQLSYRHPTIHSILRILIGRSKNHC
jgi:hypothetical protein